MDNSDSEVEFNVNVGQGDGRDLQESPLRQNRDHGDNNNEHGDRRSRRCCHHGGARAITIKPDKYDGEEEYEQYISHFEDCAELGQWGEREMLLTLAACLKGQARVFYTSLSQREKRTYSDLTYALEQRFGSARQQFRWVTKFQTRLKLVGESMPAFGDDLRLLAKRAYSNLEPEAQEMLALHQFSKSLSVDMRCRVMDRNCKTITEAVEIVERYDDLLGEVNHDRRRNSVRMVGGSSDNQRIINSQDAYRERRVSWQNRDSGSNEGLQRTLRSIQVRLDRIERGPQRRSTDGPRRCYICRSPDHLARSCPDRYVPQEAQKADNDVSGNERAPSQ